jgi:uncharacterized protein
LPRLAEESFVPEIDPPAVRRFLPLLGGGPTHPGGRSAMTCRYRCADACAHPVPNTSDNAYFGDVVAAGMSRRGLLKAGALAGIVVTAGGGTVAGAAPAAAATAAVPRGDDAPEPEDGSALTFPPVAVNTVDNVNVPNGYDWSPLIAWGDPVVEGAPRHDLEHQTAAAQAQQFGYNCDYVAVFPLEDPDRALLVVNHEYTDEQLMFPNWTGAADATAEEIRVAMAAHGLSVVEIERVGDTGEWRASEQRRYNRRVTAMTRMKITGPAAGHPLLRTSADPTGTVVRGMLNNCAGGMTPWGTVLTGEENFNGYFGAYGDPPAELAESYARYGIGSEPGTDFWRNWEKVDDRFNLAEEPHEPHRFGWVVEIDPYDPDFTPRKRTALGRMKHEGATTAITADGRVAVYMGDDERYDYIYKFVSKEKVREGTSRSARRHNLTLLDEGDLYVAKFTGDSPGEIDGSGQLPSDGKFDGSGFWTPLVLDGKSRVPGMSVEQVLILTRLAADARGATKMDRPEDVERNPVNGRIYAALTNNSRRTPAEADEANPVAPGNDETGANIGNRHGHVIEIRERGDDPGSQIFGWQIVLVAGDPEDPTTYFAGYDKDQVSPISCPDNVAFDPAGNLWIATDGNALGFNDGMFAMPVEGPERGHLKQFLSVPVGAECCGPFITADARTALAAMQHPGETDGSTFENPSSTFPYGGVPRPTVVSVWRKAPGSKRIGA